MMEFLSNYWWVLAIFGGWYLLSKLSRKSDSNKKAAVESAFDQFAKEVVTSVGEQRAVEIVEKTLSSHTGADGFIENPLAKAALSHAADAMIEELDRNDSGKPITVEKNEHLLDAFAKRAVKSEETKNKVLTGTKKAGVFVLKVAKHLI